jgi:hypothetical protein
MDLLQARLGYHELEHGALIDGEDHPESFDLTTKALNSGGPADRPEWITSEDLAAEVVQSLQGRRVDVHPAW